MPRRRKPGIDWVEIERASRAGESHTALAKKHGLARQSIDKEANKQGWGKGPNRWLRAAKQTETARRIESPQTPQDKQLATRGNRTPENLAQVLDRISQGQPLAIAAQAAGITDETLRQWKKADQGVGKLITQARGEFLGKQYGNIAKASDRGDWKAADRILQTAPETKEQWGGIASGHGIQVNISIQAESAPPTIDVTPAKPLKD